MWAWSCDGCTAWSETLWRRVQPGSPGMTGGRPPGEAGNLCTLQEKGWKVLMRRGRKWGVWTGPAAGETSPQCFWSQMNDKTFHLQHNTAGLTLQEAGHVLQLWDVVRPVAAVFLQQGEDAVVFAAGVSRVQSLQLLEHFAPCHPFSLCVLHPRDDLATGIKIQGWCVSLCLKCISRKLLSLIVHLYVATVDQFSPSSC